MSSMAGLSNHIRSDAEILRSLSSATMCVQAAGLGDLELLHISEEKVEESRKVVLDFVARLTEALTRSVDDPSIAFLVNRIVNGPVPVEDWLESLGRLRAALESSRYDKVPMEPLENILALVSSDYSDGIRALYHRW